MSDSDDDTAVHSRQKSIFSTMGRVRNMNHLREKWTTRAKLSTSSTSELEASVSSPAASVGASNLKKRGTSTSAFGVRSVDATTARAVVPSTAAKSVQVQRFEALASWLQRSGLAVPTPSDGDAFDALYASLDEMEVAVKRELSQLLSSQWSPTTEKTPPRGPRASSLVDYMVVIGPDVADLVTRTFWLDQVNVYEATVVFAHPPQAQFNAESIEQFCFPRGICTKSSLESEVVDEFFVLVLSGGGDQGQSVQYACCLRKQIVVSGYVGGNPTVVNCMVPICYVAVVSVPWIPFYRELLRHLATRHQEELWKVKSDEVQSTIVPDALAQHIDSMIGALATIELPARGDQLRFAFSTNAVFSCMRPRMDTGEPETVTLLLNWSTRLLISALSIERVILVIGLLLVEMKIIVVSKSMSALSAGIVGLATLLYPLVWAGPLISILPPALHEYLEAPVPLLCGVDVLPDSFVLTKGTAVLMMDGDEIQLHPDDAAQVGALQLPGSGSLTRDLRVFSERLLSSSEQSRVVIGNFIARRIRRQLQDLLQLCSRVNPCNAYACMKQEQLSLSETLFLKSFMQSQMYQKYSDDQAPNEPQQNTDHVEEPRTEIEKKNTKCPSVSVSASLVSSIRDLFMMSMTGSCEVDSITPSSCHEDVPVADKPDRGVQEEGVCSKPNGEEHPIETVQSPNLTSKSNLSIEETRLGSPQTYIDSTLNGNDIQNFDVIIPTRLADALTVRHDTSDNNGGSYASQSQSDVKSQSTPTSPEKPSDRQDRHPQDSVYPHTTRSMPDVLIMFEGSLLPERASTEHINSMSKITSALPEVNFMDGQCQQNLQEHNRSGHVVCGSQHEPLIHLSHCLAATMIQAAWKKRRLISRTLNRANSFRSLSVASARTASDTTIPTSMGDWTPAELHFGTLLTMHTERGRLIDIRMRLGPEATDLQWFHGDRLCGTIALGDIHEVKAHDGNILIQTSTHAQLAFIVPPHSATGVMAFFQGLHQLVTNHLNDLPSPTTSIGSTEYNSQVLVNSRQEPERCEPAASQDPIYDRDPKVSSSMSFEEAVRSGVLVLKHGRMGRPHPKYLVCDDAIEVLSWVDPAVTNSGFHPPPSASHQANRVEKKGVRFADITEILRGKHTRVLQRSTAGRSNADLCFSIVTRMRTLDIEAFSREDFALLYDGIQQRVVAEPMRNIKEPSSRVDSIS